MSTQAPYQPVSLSPGFTDVSALKPASFMASIKAWGFVLPRVISSRSWPFRVMVSSRAPTESENTSPAATRTLTRIGFSSRRSDVAPVKFVTMANTVTLDPVCGSLMVFSATGVLDGSGMEGVDPVTKTRPGMGEQPVSSAAAETVAIRAVRIVEVVTGGSKHMRGHSMALVPASGVRSLTRGGTHVKTLLIKLLEFRHPPP